MAEAKKLIPFLLRWEGGYINHPNDKGGATNLGVTLKTWQTVGYDKDGDGDIDKEDIKLLTPEDAINKVLIPHYWNRWKADQIQNQSLANILVDWLYNSGKWGIIYPQRILNVEADGIVGPITLAALNSHNNPEYLFQQIKSARIKFCEQICINNPTQKVFLYGWLNRINSLNYIDQ